MLWSLLGRSVAVVSITVTVTLAATLTADSLVCTGSSEAILSLILPSNQAALPFPFVWMILILILPSNYSQAALPFPFVWMILILLQLEDSGMKCEHLAVSVY